MTGIETALFRDRYEILAELGEGGFGTVLKARQLATGQHVAIKILRLPEQKDPAASEKRIARFELETRLCAQMHHPNIVRLIDSGRGEGQVVYSVFEFAPGNNLAQVLAHEGRLDPQEAKHLMGQTLDALACAHALGVVHRDLNPANLMVIPTGARRNVLILDFGIGALVDGHGADATARITATNEAVGTPAYAAPEQLRGASPTPRTDLYAWGLVFLECLTGTRVMAGPSVAEVIFEQFGPGAVPIPQVIATHPIGALLRRATEKDPAARSVTAEELLRELEAIDMTSLRQPLATLPRAAAQASQPTVLNAAALATGTGERPAATARSGAAGERRQITVVCCGTIAAGPDGEALDVEQAEELYRAQQALFAETARRFDGRVAGAFADQVLLAFGAPPAREDDARRAARAALAIAAETGVRGALRQAAGRGHLDVQIGIHTGLVVRHAERVGSRGETDTFVVGTTARTASRLCALARPGHILVSAEARPLLRHHFLLVERPPSALDAGARALPLHELLCEGGVERPEPTPIVGRDDELAALHEGFRRARAGNGQAFLVSGEPGIGKSRLLAEFGRRLATEPHRWLECRCSPDGDHSPLSPIIDLLHRLIDGGASPQPGERTASLEAFLARQGFDLAAAVPLFAPLLSQPAGEPRPARSLPPQQKDRTLQALLSLFAEMAEKTPLVLVVEDLQWADPITLELLNQLAADVASCPICLVVTARLELVPTWPVPSVVHLLVGRLAPAHVAAMLAPLAGGKRLSPAVIEAVVARADGIPLFVEELLRTLIESGAVHERDGVYVPARPLSGAAIPETLRDSLTARLDRLGGARETAQLASAFGREVDLDLLAQVSPKGLSVREDLDSLVAAGLMSRKRRLKGTAYRFKHALLRDAAYESMLQKSQQDVHARIAEVLGARTPDLADPRPDPLAHPGAAAGSPRSAATPVRPMAVAAEAAGQGAAPRRGRAGRRDPGAPGRS